MININPALKKELKNIPSSSGVYMMLDKKGDVIYIGKAINLKDRIRSYLNTSSWKDRPKLYFMMPKVGEIKTVITRSENEALILEANLVNKYQPKYNVTLKDDKKFPWLMITYDETYPRVVPIRDVAGFKTKYPKTKNKFFGPYSDAGAMWGTYKILKEGFQLRLRRKPLFKDRPCMNYHIGLCSGPCQNLIKKEDYQQIVRQVEDFLMGKYKSVLKNLKSQMKEASSNLDYEKAAKIRDTIRKIEKVLEKQIVVSDDSDLSQDIFAYCHKENLMVLELFMVREGKIITIEALNINLPKETSPEEAFNEAIKQYYARTEDSNIPHEILVQTELNESDKIGTWLNARAEKVSISCPKRGKKLELIKMAQKNAMLVMERVLLSNLSEKTYNENLTESLKELQLGLSLKNSPDHIECFDISHLGGTGTVGSMVCFIDGKPDKNRYRKYKIKSLLDKPDDFQSMREVVTRRYRNNESSLPDLIIIDGGKGQLSTVKEALESLNFDLTKTDLVSLAKKQEEVFKPDKKDSILLERDSKALFLLQRIRDEAHRFAITFQRDTRIKDTFTTELEKIPGLGKAKIKRLMSYFGSLKNIQESDLINFASVLGQKEDKVKSLWEAIRII